MNSIQKLEGYKEAAAYAKKQLEENKKALDEQSAFQTDIGNRADDAIDKMMREAIRKSFRGISSDPTPEQHKVVNSLRREAVQSMRDTVALLNRWVELENLSIDYDEKVVELEHKIKKEDAAAAVSKREAAKKITNFGVPFEAVVENSAAVMARDEVMMRESDVRKAFLPMTPHYIINEEKRTVVVLLKSKFTGNVRCRGISKAHPGDKFNADIGKAIAIRRALGLEDLTAFTGKKCKHQR